MDAIENESLLMYNICCRIGLSRSQRKRNIQSIDGLTTVLNIVFSNYIFEMRICGSQSEGISLIPVEFNLANPSDTDIMYISHGINVQEHVDTTNTNQAEVLQLLPTDSPEQVLLEVKSYKRTNTTFWLIRLAIEERQSKFLVSSSRLKGAIKVGATNASSNFPSLPMFDPNNIMFKNIEIPNTHGPALVFENFPYSDIGSVDCVCCLRCYEWPTAAHEWIDRTRPHGWPSQDLIDQIMYDGCEVVPFGRNDHLDGDVEWRLSFSRAETRLIRNFNIYQTQCYQLLKVVKTNLISSVVADSLSSYHIKTVMLHTVEQTDPTLWRRDNLAQCFMMCLSNLKQCLADKFLPHYFIVRQNLLEPKVTGDVHQKVLEIVTDLDKIGWTCILQCPVLHTMYQSIQETVGSIPCTPLTDFLELERNTYMISRYFNTLLTSMVSEVTYLSYNSYVIHTAVFCEKTFLIPTAIHPSVETARLIQLLHNGTLGLLLTVFREMAHPDLRPGIDPLMNFARQCLEESCNADVSSCRLKCATFFFHLGEYDRCIATVRDVLERFKDVWIVVGGRSSYFEALDQSQLQFELNRILQFFDNGFAFISNHVSLPTFFTHWEVAVATKGVQFLHKNICNNALLNNLCMDSIVYAHHLLVESYLKIDKHDDAEHALINMKETIRNGNDDMFDRNCLGFCEEDNLLLQYSESLMQVANVKDKLNSGQEDV